MLLFPESLPSQAKREKFRIENCSNLMESVTFYREERAHARPSETRPSRNGNRQAVGSACLKEETGLKAQGAGQQIGEDRRREPGFGAEHGEAEMGGSDRLSRMLDSCKGNREATEGF